MNKNIKKIYYRWLEKYIYKRDIKRLGVSFEEYSAFVNNQYEDNLASEHTWLLGQKIQRISNFAYMHSIMEIFMDEVYKFESNNKAPLILDCGANIGLSIIYMKQLYPQAKIIAFEADPTIMNICRNNMTQFGMKDVELVEAAVWIEEGFMNFLPDNTLGGKLEDSAETEETVKVRTLQLKTYLNQFVDFLKIDIEGAELDVIIDCKESLKNVGILFIEYHSFTKETQKLDVLLKILTDAGFRYYMKEATPIMRHPFVDNNKIKAKNQSFDLQLNIFAYR